MCKRRPRRSGERVCGTICREQERDVLLPKGPPYGMHVDRLRGEPTRSEPTERSSFFQRLLTKRESARREPAIPTNRAHSPVPIVPVEPTMPIAPILPSPSIVSIAPTTPTVPIVPILPTAPAYTNTYI